METKRSLVTLRSPSTRSPTDTHCMYLDSLMEAQVSLWLKKLFHFSTLSLLKVSINRISDNSPHVKNTVNV